ncbi:Hypoxia induced protein, domain [Dillenia turbinata]|uniref:Hypoxia induced protein, domain n=1 Tax=Dillenia turbinata TaxID=194707 RepID=A0AAN8V8K9_9MAGN
MEAVQAWVAEHKLTSIGALWASAIGASLAYSGRKSPLKTSLRLIHARMHAQALTLAVLSGAAAYHYYEKQTAQGETTSPNLASIPK